MWCRGVVHGRSDGTRPGGLHNKQRPYDLPGSAVLRYELWTRTPSKRVQSEAEVEHEDGRNIGVYLSSISKSVDELDTVQLYSQCSHIQ